MPTLTVTAVEADRITFVEAVIEADQAHRIRLEPRFDGPIWPPRTDDGWDENGLTETVAPGRTAVGFATPVRPSGEPLELVEAELVDDRLPAGIRAWIDRMETRLEAAEQFDEIDSLADATDAVASAGDLGTVETLAADIERDRRLARRLSIVPERTSERLDSVDIPARTLARIASGADERD